MFNWTSKVFKYINIAEVSPRVKSRLFLVFPGVQYLCTKFEASTLSQRNGQWLGQFRDWSRGEPSRLRPPPSAPGTRDLSVMDERSGAPHLRAGTGKVTIVGTGAVGLAAGYAILIKGMGKPLVLIDVEQDRLFGEIKDFQQAVPFTRSDAVLGGTDYTLTADSTVCVITAGKRQAPGQSRLELLQDNIKILKHIMSELIKYSPDAFFVIATNPVDILTYAAWKCFDLPQNRIIGTGAHLDSARFHHYIAEYCQVPVHAVDGWIIGGHGESAVPVWSSVRISGQPCATYDDRFSDDAKNDLFKKVVDSAAELIKLKGYTSEAIGLSIADIVEAIYFHRNKVMSVTTLMKGHHCIETETFASLPCILGGNGISYVIDIPLSEDERNDFHKSIKALENGQKEIEEFIK